MKSVYVHIPFCLSKCAYCDFSSGPASSAIEMDAYFEALNQEIHSRVKGVCTSLYFGGGTPSCVPAEKILQCLQTIQAHTQSTNSIEITIEINPATVDETKLGQYLAAGINRISLGVQSMQDAYLQVLGRGHNASQAQQAFDMARRAGFKNISCDLIYGIPGQNLVDFRNDLEIVAGWQPEHVSLYVLSIEEKTRIYNEITEGKLAQPDDDLVADMFLFSKDFLEEKGYFQYELCSFSKKGYQCQHNIGYWKDRPYFGLGMSAHSFIEGMRSWNTADIATYIQMIKTKNEAWIGQETLAEQARMAESILLRLRLTEGLKKKEYQGKSPYWDNKFMPILNKFEKQGLLLSDFDSIWLTKKGMLLSDIVFRELV